MESLLIPRQYDDNRNHTVTGQLLIIIPADVSLKEIYRPGSVLWEHARNQIHMTRRDVDLNTKERMKNKVYRPGSCLSTKNTTKFTVYLD